MPRSTIIEIPSIETERAILRAHRPGDFDAYAKMWATPEVTRFIGGDARTREESWIRFLRHAGTWAMLGYGFWAIEEKTSGHFIGEAGYHQIFRGMTPSIDGFPECGWAVAPDMQGKCFATEIVTAVVAWGDRMLGGQRQVCIIDRDNQASIRLASRCGFGNPVDARFGERTVLLFERQGSTRVGMMAAPVAGVRECSGGAERVNVTNRIAPELPVRPRKRGIGNRHCAPNIFRSRTTRDASPAGIVFEINVLIENTFQPGRAPAAKIRPRTVIPSPSPLAVVSSARVSKERGHGHDRQSRPSLHHAVAGAEACHAQ